MLIPRYIVNVFAFVGLTFSLTTLGWLALLLLGDKLDKTRQEVQK